MKTFSKVYIYLRFSSDGQAEGHSFERQRGSARTFLKSRNIDESAVEWVEDPAFSAFHGEHIKSGALGKLLDRVRKKIVSNGLLIFESVDRASRQGSMALLSMLNEFLEAGFYIYFLDQPAEEPFNRDSPPPFFYTYLSMRAEIARFESLRKSEFSEANWSKRRQMARESGVPFTSECPSWLRVVDGKYQVEDALVGSIRTVFEFARDGWGVSKIVRYANQQNLPVPGKGAKWHLSLVQRLLSNRALIGEFQPFVGTKSRRTPEGAPIDKYYPVVIDPELFLVVGANRNKTSHFPNRRDANNYNYLAGLAKCECGGVWRRLNKNSGKQRGYSQYSCANRQLAVSQCKNLPSRTFDFFFIGVACEKIPSLLSISDSSRESKRIAFEVQQEALHSRIQKLIELYENLGISVEEVTEKIKRSRLEQLEVKEKLAEFERTQPPSGKFDFEDAVAAFLPAFLNVYHDEDSEEAQRAFRARALFRIKIVQSVETIMVNHARTSMRITLKNGVQFDEAIEQIEFSVNSDLSDDEVFEIKNDYLRASGKLLGV